MNPTDYDLLDSQLRALLEQEPDALAATSNFVALLYNAIDNINVDIEIDSNGDGTVDVTISTTWADVSSG